MTDILIVEDNAELSDILCDLLTASGYSSSIADTGEKALEMFEQLAPRLVVLDIMLPGLNGFEVCQRLRSKSNVPIIIVSAKNEKDDMLSGLILGADDYIEKPYDFDILLAKIDGIFKRRYKNSIIRDGNIMLDKNKRSAYLNDKELTLTSKEFELLLLFLENKGKALSKDEIFNKIWGFESVSEMQTLTVHIKWLRQKIETDPKNPKRLQTVWGVGYRFV